MEEMNKADLKKRMQDKIANKGLSHLVTFEESNMDKVLSRHKYKDSFLGRIRRVFIDDSPKEKFNEPCDTCHKTRSILFRQGNWGIKTYICFPCLMLKRKNLFKL